MKYCNLNFMKHKTDKLLYQHYHYHFKKKVCNIVYGL